MYTKFKIAQIRKGEDNMKRIIAFTILVFLLVGCNNKQEIENLKKQIEELKTQNIATSIAESKNTVLKYCMAEINQSMFSGFRCDSSYFVNDLSEKNNCEKGLGDIYDSLVKEGRILQKEEHKKQVFKKQLDEVKSLCKAIREETSLELKKEKCEEIGARIGLLTSFLVCKFRTDFFENIDISKLSKAFEPQEEDELLKMLQDEEDFSKYSTEELLKMLQDLELLKMRQDLEL